MKTFFLIITLFLTSLFIFPDWAQSYTVRGEESPVRILEDFSNIPEGDFPTSFRTWPFQRGKAQKVYRVQKEGNNKFLAAFDNEDISVQVFKKAYWVAKKHPFISWRWRAKILPKGADESIPQKNDSACGVYIVFGGYNGKSLKYSWSSSLPIDYTYEKKKGQSFTIVKNLNNPHLWQQVKINVIEEYKRLFHEEPKLNPIGFGILTDGNALHTASACDYDDFVISNK